MVEEKLFEYLNKETINVIDPALRELTINELVKITEDTLSPVCSLSKKINKPVDRWQDDIILREVPENSSVLDLGCGEGKLLKKLICEKDIKGQGIEISDEAVFRCIEKGVPIFQANLDEGLVEFENGSYDYVILEETLQTLHSPIKVLREMLRVGRKGIVSFPNFGYWRVRLYLALKGKMPVTEELPHHWYDTPNIHLLTLLDFFDWVKEENVNITKGYLLSEGEICPLEKADNLFSDEVLLIIERKD
jgi:methionine biosynthesis protein MetW